MPDGYFDLTRREIEPLLPVMVKKIVDVGCGAGYTSIWLKSVFPDVKTIGLEGNHHLRDKLLRSLDEVYIVDLNGDLPNISGPDLVLFLDVLEHLYSPETVIKRFVSDLAPGGHVIVSLPNVAHLSVSIPLLFRGRFDYQASGILDRTHVRFFVRNTAVKMLNDAGLKVIEGLEAGLRNPKTRLLNRLTFGFVRDRLTKQYILKATKMNEGEEQGPVLWRAC